MQEGTKTCKCCGLTVDVNAFDKSNTGKPIGICKQCRRQQQRINDLSRRSTLSVAQQERLAEAINYMRACKQATGFETGKYSSRIGAVSTAVIIADREDLKDRAIKAQERRKRLTEQGIPLPAPSLECLVNLTAIDLIEAGYTFDECFKVLDAEVNRDNEAYDKIANKLYEMPL